MSSVQCCCGCDLQVVATKEGEHAGQFNHFCIHTDKPINAMCAAEIQPENGKWKNIRGEIKIIKPECFNSQEVCRTCIKGNVTNIQTTTSSVTSKVTKVVVKDPDFFKKITRNVAKQMDEEMMYPHQLDQ